MAKRTSKKTTTSRSAKEKPAPAKATEAAAPVAEPVTRYELLGACDFALCDAGDRIDAKARQALLDAHHKRIAWCVIQCEEYVFNLTMVPFITLMDAARKITASSLPKETGTTAPRA